MLVVSSCKLRHGFHGGSGVNPARWLLCILCFCFVAPYSPAARTPPKVPHVRGPRPSPTGAAPFRLNPCTTRHHRFVCQACRDAAVHNIISTTCQGTDVQTCIPPPLAACCLQHALLRCTCLFFLFTPFFLIFFLTNPSYSPRTPLICFPAVP